MTCLKSAVFTAVYIVLGINNVTNLRTSGGKEETWTEKSSFECVKFPNNDATLSKSS